MLDKYLFLMLLVAANTVGVESDELTISYVQATGELTEEGFKEPGYENVSLVMTKEEGNNWLVKDINRNKSALFDISDSKIMIKDKNPISLNFDWIDFRAFQLNDRDTLYHAQNGTEQLEIFRSRKQKIMKIKVLDEDRAQKTNPISIHY